MFRYLFFGLGLALFLGACQPKPLPFLGERLVDSIPYTVSQDFSLINQDSQLIDGQTVKGKVYIVDFFFSHCPSICPKVKKEMHRVYDKFKGNPDFVMLSHSIDFKRDTVGRLKWYAQKLDLSTPTWHLLRADFPTMQKLALSYLLAAAEDPDAPGGFDHSGAITLIDRKGRIRGIYNGLESEKVDLLMQDAQRLLDNPEE